MRTLCGAVTETKDLGVVAEICPHCDRLMSCLLRTVNRGNYVCFVKMAELSRESSCLCTGCLKTFPGKPYWTYEAVVPIADACGMELNDLLAKTNPILADRIQFQAQIRELGGDHRFAEAYEKVERMRPGRLRSDLFRQLMEWPRMDLAQRDKIEQEIRALSHAWQFARQAAFKFPASTASLAYLVAALAVVLVLIGVFVARSWLWASVAAGAILIPTLIVEGNLLRRSVGRWVLQVLIPEANEANVRLDRFIAVVDDVPGCKLGLTEDLWPMKNQLQRIRQILAAEKQLP